MSQEDGAIHLPPDPYGPKPPEIHLPEAHEGHGGTRFESGDATPGIVIWSLAIIAGMLVFVFAITVGIQRFLADKNPEGQLPSAVAPARVLPPQPQLQVHPWEELPQLREHENQVLNSYGKSADGHVHIPIDQAMDAVVSRLPIRPDAPPGTTTPSGEGRSFAGSLSAIPAPDRGPQIRGEIHKNAQH